MSKLEWGTKRICQSCTVKFYDFKRSPIVCPKCSAVFDPETLLKSRRSRPPAAAKPSKPAAPAKIAAEKKDDTGDDDKGEGEGEDKTKALAGAADLADVPDDDDEDKAVIEDTSDLGGEDDEISKAVASSKDDKD